MIFSFILLWIILGRINSSNQIDCVFTMFYFLISLSCNCPHRVDHYKKANSAIVVANSLANKFAWYFPSNYQSILVDNNFVSFKSGNRDLAVINFEVYKVFCRYWDLQNSKILVRSFHITTYKGKRILVYNYKNWQFLLFVNV